MIAVCWWLIASALLWKTWNLVIVPMTKLKSGKYTQALLLIAAISFVFCLPRWYSRHHGGCAMHSGCHHEGKGCCEHEGCCGHEHGMMGKDGDEECPYAHGKKGADESGEAPKKK